MDLIGCRERRARRRARYRGLKPAASNPSIEGDPLQQAQGMLRRAQNDGWPLTLALSRGERGRRGVAGWSKGRSLALRQVGKGVEVGLTLFRELSEGETEQVEA